MSSGYPTEARSMASNTLGPPLDAQHPVDRLLESVKRIANEIGMLEERMSNVLSPLNAPSRPQEVRPSASVSPFNHQIASAAEELNQQIQRLRIIRERMDL